ncbi:MAG: YihY family inner membrane protein [Alphaproteobacteria bacterium]|nr:YihY family inner membrane protein [Alphaproteobacteria bacterium]
MNLKNKLAEVKQSAKKKISTSSEFCLFLNKRIKSDAIFRVASALSYTSLLALVPLFAIALAIFAAFPVFAESKIQIQEFIVHNFLPGTGEEVKEYFNQFISASAKLTTIGVVGIAVTAIMLLSTIENTFNFIFKVNKPRRFTTKITLYWTIITLGPLLLGAAFSMRGYLYAISNMMEDNAGSFKMLVSSLIPASLTVILLISVYMLVPNKKVSFFNAFWGAVTTVILFAVLRSGIGSILLSGATYKTLYGALATVPLLLVWMYLAWAIVIFGAIVTASLEEFNYLKNNKFEEQRRNNPPRQNRKYEVRDYTQNRNRKNNNYNKK